ncbi:MAG: hypothetical protein JKY43_10995 [Phycisphaerales bacterium]|nr:hypothetical protein [Phycisphaerales bacterium]
MGLLEDKIKAEKLNEIELNYNSVKKFMLIGSKSYNISQENIVDIIGLIALNEGSNLGVKENDELTLVFHTVAELKSLLDSIRLYLTDIKIKRFDKRKELNNITDHELIVNFNTTI